MVTSRHPIACGHARPGRLHPAAQTVAATTHPPFESCQMACAALRGCVGDAIVGDRRGMGETWVEMEGGCVG